MPLETGCTYQRIDLDGNATTYTDVTVFWSAVIGEPILTGQSGKAVSRTRRAHIQASTLAVEPRQNDRIVSTTYGTWEVTSDDIVTLATRYVAHVRKVS